jgi:hypothetical protein
VILAVFWPSDSPIWIVLTRSSMDICVAVCYDEATNSLVILFFCRCKTFLIRIPNGLLFEDALRSLRRRAAPVIQTASRLDHRVRTPHRFCYLVTTSVHKCTVPFVFPVRLRCEAHNDFVYVKISLASVLPPASARVLRDTRDYPQR